MLLHHLPFLHHYILAPWQHYTMALLRTSLHVLIFTSVCLAAFHRQRLDCRRRESCCPSADGIGCLPAARWLIRIDKYWRIKLMLCASVYGRKEASSQDSIHIISYFSLKCYDKIAFFFVLSCHIETFHCSQAGNDNALLLGLLLAEKQIREIGVRVCPRRLRRGAL